MAIKPHLSFISGQADKIYNKWYIIRADERNTKLMLTWQISHEDWSLTRLWWRKGNGVEKLSTGLCHQAQIEVQIRRLAFTLMTRAVGNNTNR